MSPELKVAKKRGGTRKKNTNTSPSDNKGHVTSVVENDKNETSGNFILSLVYMAIFFKS